ncbi:MAG: phosphate acyltransferase PlsX [Alphaproteobacteria bacterium]|uniref:Phosphate acyltransferase n=1 Tax=Candidatus Nitrobium versatile TaxID=2884831 RepID=A0A953LYQ3_9BACT|nr:phosphate acyltransferase PlsX [Candidatus Nitrobium versatile]
MRVALDAMGGDFAPDVTIAGAIEAVSEYDLEVVLVGDERKLTDALAGKRYPSGKISVFHASEVVEMDESPSIALRKKKDSSIRRAVELVRNGKADAAVSAGNSGVAMATSLFLLGKLPNVDRPAIATIMPSLTGFFVLMDAGANVDCKPENLLQFAHMGNAYYKAIFNAPSPRIALLSIGEEDTKGNELTKVAFKYLKNAEMNFTGNIEGKDIFLGDADVIICDGFIGNIVLKVSEGLAETIIKMLKREIAGITTGKLGYLMIKPAIRNFKKRTDYSEYGGAPLLGINGTCIISHGRSSAKAIKNAVKVSAEMAKKKVHEIIAHTLMDSAPQGS